MHPHPGISTVAGRRRLSAALKRAREERSLTQQEVAMTMEWSLSKLIRIESGIVGVSATDLRALLTHYRVANPTTISDLMELARAGRRRPWWKDYRDDMYTPTLGTLIDLEAVASRLDIFNPSILPGLFQTEEYARAVQRNFLPRPTPEQVEKRVHIRMRRQEELLKREDPPHILAILDEAILHRLPGDQQVMLGQLNHLLAIANLPTVTIKILPFRAAVLQSAGPFFILSFPNDPDIVYVESTLNENLIEDSVKIRDYREIFDIIHRQALALDESIELIREADVRFR